MPYTNPDGTAAYLIDGMDSGGMLIANSTEAITADVYAQQLTFSGSGGVLSDCTISAGGSIIMGTSTTISGINQTIGIYDGGSMLLSRGAVLQNFEVQSGGFVSGTSTTKVVSGTIYSGGRIKTSGASMFGVTVKSGGYFSAYTGLYISSATVESGATFIYGGAVRWNGRENHIAAGTIDGRPEVYTDENGTLYNYNGKTAATHFTNIVVSNLTVSATTYASNGCSAYGITHKGGNLWVYSSSLLNNYNNTAGNSTTYLNLYYGTSATLSAAVVFAGSDTNIKQGTVRYWNTVISTGSQTPDPDLYATNGVFHNLTLMTKKEGAMYWLNRVNLQSGTTAYQPVVSSGGSLYIWNNAAANGAQVHDKGALWLFNGAYADAPVINAGGILITSAATVDNLTIIGDGTTGERLVVSNGVRLNLGGSETTFSAGTIRYGHATSVAKQQIDETFRAEDGKLYGLTLKSSGSYALKTLGIRDGISAVETVISSGGVLYASSGATVVNATVNNLGTISAYAGAVISGGSLSGANISSAGLLSADADTVISGALVIDAYGALVNGRFAEGAELRLKNNAKFGGDALNVGKGQIYLNDTVAADAYVEDGVLHDLTVENFTLGVVSGLQFDNIKVKTGARINVNSKATIANTLFEGGSCFIYSACSASNCTLGNDGVMYLYKNASATDLVVSGGILQVSSSNARVYDATVLDGALLLSVGQISGATVAGGELTAFKGAIVSGLAATGGTVNLSSGAALSGATLAAGAELNVSGGATVTALSADAGADVNVLYKGTTGIGTAIFDNLDNVTSLSVSGVTAGNTYVLTAADAAATLIKGAKGLYENAVAKGQSYTNGIDGVTYSFDGTALTATAAAIGTASAAAKLADGATTINNGDKAAKWDATTTYSTNVYLAEGMTAGDAWLTIDGFADTAANIYGTAKNQNFSGAVNIGAASGTIKNLAGGAALGGTVAGVKLTVGGGMNITGAVYAGGMGNVTDETETLIEGGTFGGNIFAGALCNYAAKPTATATDDIELTVNGGTFGGNIYAGAAVKAGAATGIVHAADDIEIELNDGKATRQTFCVYGGGYATGTVEDALVYEADEVEITINGGEWGTYLSGRGIFGGVYADKVAASVGSVDITVSGGTMGNIYGGGWAQNGGTSTVTGAVNITIDGDAEVANVFGGGSYSASSYGATIVGNVNILVAGGNVANNIFAAGQNEFSTVTGDVSVTFTGSNDYACNVYGYGVQKSATTGGDKTLAFTAYTGTISGNIGGFDKIRFSGDAGATFTGAWNAIDNSDWIFDVAVRDTELAGTAILDWSDADFTGDTITLNLASGSTAEWSLIKTGDSTVYNKFDVQVDGASILPETIDIDDQIADGAYAGWGFTDEGGMLKFKNLA